MAKRDLQIKTTDGVCAAGLFGDVGRSRAGVILYMDAFGPRPALDQMAERIAAWGYLVLVPDLLYRGAPYGPFDAATTFQNEGSKKALMALVGGLTLDMTDRDTGFFVQAFTDAGATGPIGAVGYCMGGGRALSAVASYPDRVKAGASFHGGRLADGTPASPAANAAKMKDGRLYIGVAAIDSSFPPEQSAALALALREAQIDHTIENYVGCAHGWCVPDHSVFNPEGAERHWRRLETFFGEALQG